MARVITPEEKYRKEMAILFKKAESKKWNYKIEDFEIIPNKWRHKNWKVWMQGKDNISDTTKLVKRYIQECNNPYMERNLDFIHLYNN